MNGTPPGGIVIPGRKQDLVLRLPWLNGAGTLGFGDESAAVIDPARLGGFVTNPVSLAPRTPSRGEHVIRFPGGLLLHTGHPNPGLDELIRRHRPGWLRLPCPVIVHVLARSSSEMVEMCARLDGVEPVAAIEVGLRDDEPDLAIDLVETALRLDIPVLAHIPLTADTRWAQDLARAGASALVAGPMRGSLPGASGQLVAGRIFGPCLFPLALHAARRLASAVHLPCMVGGGIMDAAQRQAVLNAGAVAAILDLALWSRPEAVLQSGD